MARSLALGLVLLALAARAKAEKSGGFVGLTESSKLSGRYVPVAGTKGMVVCDDSAASEWGAQILRKGGNAVDAAVATGFMLAVTRPHFASLGGGGFMLYCPHHVAQAEKDCVVIDYREIAPAAATRDMYVKDGKARNDLSEDGALASGVPGVPAGLLLAHKKYGSLSLRTILSRPIETAKDGFRFTAYAEHAAVERWRAMNPAAKELFGCKIGDEITACPPGTVIHQLDLAKVLEAIQESGTDGFYRGWVAQAIARQLKAAGGIITEADLASYQPKVRVPLYGTYHGLGLVTMPPPSSGGAIILQLFEYMELAEKAGAFTQGYGSAGMIHAVAHAMALAFADRSKYFGDPDFVKIDVKALLSEGYTGKRWSSTYDAAKANLPSAPGDLESPEGKHTTHFSVIDAKGNAVAVTTTINDDFGSGFVPKGTGVVMNDEMDDFSIMPGVPNLYGLIGAEANAIAPGKKPLSSMAPTMLLDKNGDVRIVIGAMGGPKIITAVFGALFDRLYFGMSLLDAVTAPRIHQQWTPADLTLETFGFSPEVRARLSAMGYSVKESDDFSQIHALERFPDGRVWGAPDLRAEGAAVAQ
jgi:gamma-glutamyltranspeptidase/glutathione hydrolase